MATRMALRIRTDPSSFAIGLEPLTPRAHTWIETHAVPRGGIWTEIGGARCFWIVHDELSLDQIRSSGLDVSEGRGDHPTAGNKAG